MAQITLNSTGVASSGALVLQSNGTTTAVTVSTGQVATLVNDAVVNGLTVGRGAGAVATNTAVGSSALAANSTGAEITAIGRNALAANTVSYSTAVGANALTANTTGAANAAFGAYALSTNTTGAGNSAFGGFGFGLSDSALQANTTGSNNSAFGLGALKSNTTASNNTAVGYQAGYTNTTGTGTIAFGYQAGYTNNANNGTFVGTVSGNSSTGAANTFVGYGSGYVMTSGAKNTILGSYNGNQGGLDIRTSSNHIVLSDGDGNPRGVFDSSGNLLVGTTSTSPASSNVVGFAVNNSGFISLTGNATSAVDCNRTNDGIIQAFRRGGTLVGNVSVTTVATAYNTSSDYRLKNTIAPMTGALEKVALLKPCTYKWNANGSDGEGFIAHELAEVCPQAVSGEKDAVDAYGKAVYQGIDTSFLVATLTAAIQELKAEFDAYKATHP